MNVYERIFKLWTSICKMLIDGTRDPEKIAEALELVAKTVQLIVNEPRMFVKEYFRRLFEDETLTLDATDGTETLAKADDVFTGYIEPYFVNWKLDTLGKPTPAIQVTVHEMCDKDGGFKTIYGSLNNDLNKLRLSQSQIKLFAKAHRDKLRIDCYGTFFMFTRGDEPADKDKSNVFVACVCVDGLGRLKVYVNGFSDGDVWRASRRLRFVIPQL